MQLYTIIPFLALVSWSERDGQLDRSSSVGSNDPMRRHLRALGRMRPQQRPKRSLTARAIREIKKKFTRVFVAIRWSLTYLIANLGSQRDTSGTQGHGGYTDNHASFLVGLVCCRRAAQYAWQTATSALSLAICSSDLIGKLFASCKGRRGSDRGIDSLPSHGQRLVPLLLLYLEWSRSHLHPPSARAHAASNAPKPGARAHERIGLWFWSLMIICWISDIL